MRAGRRPPDCRFVHLPLHAPQHALAITQRIGLVPHHDIQCLQGAVCTIFRQEANQLYLVCRRRLLLEIISVGIQAEQVVLIRCTELLDSLRRFIFIYIFTNISDSGYYAYCKS